MFCAGANIRMLGKASHGHKVNFCKFTNETRLAIEDASENSGQRYLAAISGSAAGGGYELAVTAEHIMLIDDRRSSVSLPELPLLAVLPGTGGLTRLTDKRRVRRDRADVFCTTEEGVRGKRAVRMAAGGRGRSALGLGREGAPNGRWRWRRGPTGTAIERHRADAAATDVSTADAMPYPHVHVALDRAGAVARRSRSAGPPTCPPTCRHPCRRGGVLAAGDGARTGRRVAASAPERADLGLMVFRTRGRSGAGAGGRCVAGAVSGRLAGARNPLLLKRVFKRVDMTARSLITLIEPGSCFAGTPGRTGFRGGPRGHVRRCRGRRQSRPGHAASVAAEFRRLSRWATA